MIRSPNPGFLEQCDVDVFFRTKTSRLTKDQLIGSTLSILRLKDHRSLSDRRSSTLANSSCDSVSVDCISQYFQAFATYVNQFLFSEHHPVVYDYFGVWKAQDLGRACLRIFDNYNISSYGIFLCFILAMHDLRKSLEKVSLHTMHGLLERSGSREYISSLSSWCPGDARELSQAAKF